MRSSDRVGCDFVTGNCVGGNLSRRNSIGCNLVCGDSVRCDLLRDEWWPLIMCQALIAFVWIFAATIAFVATLPATMEFAANSFAVTAKAILRSCDGVCSKFHSCYHTCRDVVRGYSIYVILLPVMVLAAISFAVTAPAAIAAVVTALAAILPAVMALVAILRSSDCSSDDFVRCDGVCCNFICRDCTVNNKPPDACL